MTVQSDTFDPASLSPEPNPPVEQTASEAPAADEKTTEEKAEEERKPKPDWIQKRLDKMTEQKYELKAEAKSARAEAEYWRRIAEQKSAGETPKAQGKPSVQDFDSQEEFIEALTDWKLSEREKARATEQTKSTERARFAEIEEAHAKRETKARETYEDYDDAIDNLRLVGLPPASLEFLGDSEQSADILYFLGTNIKEARRIAALSPARALAELGKLELKVSSDKQRKPATTAPAPITPVGSRAHASDDPDKMPMDEFARWWKKQT